MIVIDLKNEKCTKKKKIRKICEIEFQFPEMNFELIPLFFFFFFNNKRLIRNTRTL